MHPVPWVGLLLRRHPPGLQCQRRSWYRAVSFHRKKIRWSWKAVEWELDERLNNGWLEDDPFLLGWSNFQGAFAVSFSESNGGFWLDFGWVVFFGRTSRCFSMGEIFTILCAGFHDAFSPSNRWEVDFWLETSYSTSPLELGTQKSMGFFDPRIVDPKRRWLGFCLSWWLMTSSPFVAQDLTKLSSGKNGGPWGGGGKTKTANGDF